MNDKQNRESKEEQELRANCDYENGERIRKGLKPLSFKTWKTNKGVVNAPKNSSEEYLRRAEIKGKLDESIPDSVPPEVAGKPIKDFVLSYKDAEGNQRIIEDKKGKNEIVFKPQKNENLIFLTKFSDSVIYYDKRDFSFWQYIMTFDRKHIIRKLRIADHDFISMLCLCLLEIYGEQFLRWKQPRINVTKSLLAKIILLTVRWRQIE